MDRTRLLAEMAAAQAPPEEVLYLERLGGDYRWRFVSPGALQAGTYRARRCSPGRTPVLSWRRATASGRRTSWWRDGSAAEPGAWAGAQRRRSSAATPDSASALSVGALASIRRAHRQRPQELPAGRLVRRRRQLLPAPPRLRRRRVPPAEGCDPRR
jgi:hypothetical protein